MMERIEIQEINKGIEVLKGMLMKMNEQKILQLDTHFTLELLRDEEEISFSNIHDNKDTKKLMSFTIIRTYENIKITFNDWTQFIEYKIETNTKNEKANDLLNYCRDIAVNGKLQTMANSINKIFNDLNK